MLRFHHARVFTGTRPTKVPQCKANTACSSSNISHGSRHTLSSNAPQSQRHDASTLQHRTSNSAAHSHANGNGSSEVQESTSSAISPLQSQIIIGSSSTAEVAVELQALKQQVSLLLEMARISQQQNIQLQAQLTALAEGLTAANPTPTIASQPPITTITAATSLPTTSTPSSTQAPLGVLAAAPTAVSTASSASPAMSERAKTVSRLGFNASVSGSFDSEEEETLHIIKGGVLRAEDPQEEEKLPPSPSRWSWAMNRASPRVLRQGGRSILRVRDTLDEEDPQGRETLDSHDEGIAQKKEQQQGIMGSDGVLRRSYDPDDVSIANPFQGGVGESDAARERRVAPASRWDETSSGAEYVPAGRKEWNSQQRGRMEIEKRDAAAATAAATAVAKLAASAVEQREAEEARAWQDHEELVALQIAAEEEAAAVKLAAAKLAAGRRAAADLAAADIALAQRRLASQPAFEPLTEDQEREMFMRVEEEGLMELQRHMQQWQQQSSLPAPDRSIPVTTQSASAVEVERIETPTESAPVHSSDSPVFGSADEDDEMVRMMKEELSGSQPDDSSYLTGSSTTSSPQAEPVQDASEEDEMVRMMEDELTSFALNSATGSTVSTNLGLSSTSTSAATAPSVVSPVSSSLSNTPSSLDLMMRELLDAELKSASVSGSGASSGTLPTKSQNPRTFPKRVVPPQAQQQRQAPSPTPVSPSVRVPLVTTREAAAALSSVDLEGLSAVERMNLLPRVDKVLLTPGPPPARGDIVAAAAARPQASQRYEQRDGSRGGLQSRDDSSRGGATGRDTSRSSGGDRAIKTSPSEVLSPAAAAAAALLRGPPKSSRQRIASRIYGETGSSGASASAASPGL